MQKQKKRNPVAHFAARFNKAAVFDNKKHKAKLGYLKHKRPFYLEEAAEESVK